MGLVQRELMRRGMRCRLQDPRAPTGWRPAKSLLALPTQFIQEEE